MIINSPIRKKADSAVEHQFKVKSNAGESHLTYSIDEKFLHLLTDSCDSAVVGLLLPAMAAGEDIHVRGRISEKLLYNLATRVQRLLRYLMPSLKEITITADEIDEDTPPYPTGVATGFSGGVDSYSVLADHFQPHTPKSLKITHLLFNNVGSHGMGGKKLFEQRFTRLLPVVERLGLPFITIDSNLDSFYGRGLGFEQTHTLRNLSAALLLQNGIRRYIYASSLHYTDVHVGAGKKISAIELILLPLASTHRLEAFLAGAEYTRVEKTLRVATIPESYTSLDVCTNPNNTSGYTNCGACSKCLRTLLTLDIVGYIDRYHASFDLSAYYKHKNDFIARILSSSDPLLKELVRFAKDSNYPFPVTSKIFSNPILYKAARKLRKATTLAMERARKPAKEGALTQR
jgi:hypothetical protein